MSQSLLKDWVNNKFTNVVSESIYADKTIYCNGDIIGNIASGDITDEYVNITYSHVMAGNTTEQTVAAFNAVVPGHESYVPTANDVTGIITIPSSGLYSVNGSCTLTNYSMGNRFSITLSEVISGDIVIIVNKTISAGTTNPVLIFNSTFLGKDSNMTYHFTVQNETWSGANPIVTIQGNVNITRIK